MYSSGCTVACARLWKPKDAAVEPHLCVRHCQCGAVVAKTAHVVHLHVPERYFHAVARLAFAPHICQGTKVLRVAVPGLRRGNSKAPPASQLRRRKPRRLVAHAAKVQRLFHLDLPPPRVLALRKQDGLPWSRPPDGLLHCRAVCGHVYHTVGIFCGFDHRCLKMLHLLVLAVTVF